MPIDRHLRANRAVFFRRVEKGFDRITLMPIDRHLRANRAVFFRRVLRERRAIASLDTDTRYQCQCQPQSIAAHKFYVITGTNTDTIFTA